MPFGPECLLPPAVAIVLAIVTRKVLPSLALGVLIGAVLLANANATWQQVPAIFFASVWRSVRSTSHIQVVVFTLLMGAMVGVMESGGGIKNLIDHLSRHVRSRRGTQTMIATSGLVIFFDDYANSLLVGGTMREPADRFGISREKLAYLVDSTSAPVAGLSLIGTWAAVEIDYIAEGLVAAGVDEPAAALTMFVRSIPFRFYSWLALAVVFAVALTQRDLGPMRQAEQLAMRNRNNSSTRMSPGQRAADERWLWLAAVLPVTGCVVAVIVTLVATSTALIDRHQTGSSGTGRLLIQVLGRGDPYISLIVGSAVGLALALILHRALGRTRSGDLLVYMWRGALQMLPAILILWLAWALSAMTDEDQLNTAGYLAGVLSDRLTPVALPTLVFVIAGATAFSTGTSWGTMAMLTPLAIGLAFQLVGTTDPASLVVPATCGSVLAGAIFGDHCSPISDTTVLSSRASGCDHVAHVRTQMPYALLAAGAAILLGTLPASFGFSPWHCLAVATAAVFAWIRWFGSPPVEPQA